MKRHYAIDEKLRERRVNERKKKENMENFQFGSAELDPQIDIIK